MEIEMLCRAAMVYGSNMKNMEKAKEYANRIASLNPGEPKLNRLYHIIDVEYNPSKYTDIFNPELIESEQKIEIVPEEQPIKEVVEPKVSITPNPANPITTIHYSLPEASFVKLDVYSINGQKVETLVNGFMSAGKYNVILDGSHFGSGIFLYRFQAENFKKTGKMLILK